MKAIFPAFTLVLLASLPALSIEVTGSISGTARDSQGSPLAGVTVSVAAPVLQGIRIVVTRADGAYSVAKLPPGRPYSVTFTLAGFRNVEIAGLDVFVGKDTQVNGIMDLAPVSADVVVSGERPTVDVTQTNVQQNFSSEYLRKIPVGSGARDYLTIAQQAPMVVGTGNSNVAGGNLLENSYLIDGVNTTDPVTHTFTENLNFDAIQDIQLQTASYLPEFGRATGGILNVITKSGGDDFHGNADIRYSNNHWTEKGDHFNPGVSESRNTPWDVTLGGPILKDRLWFFGNVQRPDNFRTPFRTPPWARSCPQQQLVRRAADRALRGPPRYRADQRQSEHLRMDQHRGRKRPVRQLLQLPVERPQSQPPGGQHELLLRGVRQPSIEGRRRRRSHVLPVGQLRYGNFQRPVVLPGRLDLRRPVSVPWLRRRRQSDPVPADGRGTAAGHRTRRSLLRGVRAGSVAALQQVDLQRRGSLRPERVLQQHRRERPELRQVAPRFGIAYDLMGNGRDVFRASYGQFYIDRALTFARLFDTGINSGLSKIFRWNATTQRWVLVQTTGGNPITQALINTPLKPTYDEQINAAFEHQLFQGSRGAASASVGYVYKHTKNIFEDSCTDQTNCPDFWITNQPGLDIGQQDVLKKSYYAYYTQVQYFSTRFFVNASYAYSKSRGSIDSSQGQYAGTDVDHFPENFVNRYGFLDDDARHRVKFSAVYQIPFIETRFGLNYFYRTGLPYTDTHNTSFGSRSNSSSHTASRSPSSAAC